MSGGYCEKHDLIVSDGLACPYCVQAERREQINILESRISDLSDELRDLRERFTQLDHIIRGARRADLVQS